jgi:photosystem II stability/assembly factor-like uncharacterized protein
MFGHLDDAEELHTGTRELAAVLRRAGTIRARRRWMLAVGSCGALLAASIGFFLARPSGQATSTAADYQFNLLSGPLRVGTPVPTTALLDVQFASVADGYALALHRNTVILAGSTNGGASWQVRNDHLPTGVASTADYPGQMEFVGSNGYLWGAQTASGAPLWVSHDDGTSWHRADVGPYVVDVSAIDLNVWALTQTCPDVSTGASPGCSMGIAESFDGGSTWTASVSSLPGTLAQPGGRVPLPVELARITKMRAYVLTKASGGAVPTWQVAFTDDGGAIWSQRTVPCADPFTLGVELAASGTNDLWLLCGSQASAGAQSKQLFRSTDGGGSWLLAASATGLGTPPAATVAPDPLPLGGYVSPFTIGHHNLAVASTTTAWLFPARSSLYKTDDGGGSWTEVPSLSADGFGSGGAGNVTFISATEGWICSYGVGLWHTDDGESWAPLGAS